MNILSNYKSSDVRNFPFPHIVLENAFSNDVYEKLACSYPIKEINDANSFKKKSNERIQISSVEMEELESLDEVWKETYKNHTSEEFYFDFVRLFSNFFTKYYGKENARKLKNFSSIGKRNFNENYINLDFQPGINTPQRRYFRKSVRGPHLDNPKEIFAALIYFRTKEDNSFGGNLEICSKKSKKLNFFGKMEVPRSQIKVEKIIDYSSNNGIFFLNSIDSIHSITNRSFTKENRRLLNIIGEANEPLFKIEKGKSFYSRVKRRINKYQSDLGINR